MMAPERMAALVAAEQAVHEATAAYYRWANSPAPEGSVLGIAAEAITRAEAVALAAIRLADASRLARPN